MRRYSTALLGIVLIVALAAAGAGAVSALAGSGDEPRAATSARGEYPLDFIRVLQLIADLRAHPPAEPLVCLLGGSSARECTVSNDSWSDAVSLLRGYRVRTVNLGSKHRMFNQDLRLVGYLPEGTDIVFIGVNMGRFCNGPYDPPVILPDPSPVTGARGSAPAAGRATTKIWPDWRKRQVAEQWMVKRWPHFEDRYRYNLRALARICRGSLSRGEHPVILDLPRNMDIIGHRLDQPLRLYHRGCRAIAERLGIPYVQFQSSTGLTNKDFSDLWHTVPSGKVKWEHALAATTARLLKQYGIGPAPSPPPSPQPTPEPSPSGSTPPSS
jgi:hypothetical protein